jgi:Fe-Mn family superoxide dismutase
MVKFELPELGYEYNALEPYIDEETMKLHHTKHHQAYTDKFNEALKKHPELEFESAEQVIMNLEEIPEDIRAAVRNHGGGYLNHSFFWSILKKDVKPVGRIKEAIEEKFGSFEKFKDEFSEAALGVFGSGWAWFVVNEDGGLEIVKTQNQDSPISTGKTPLIAIDVWEHAYYKKYENRRAEYIENFFNVINWEKVNKLFMDASE